MKKQRGKAVLPFNLLAFWPLLGSNPESRVTNHEPLIPLSHPMRSRNDRYIHFEARPVIKIVAIRTAGIILLIIIAHYPR